jgi:hypothetical protein
MNLTVKEFWNKYNQSSKIEFKNGVTIGWGAIWSADGIMLNDDDIITIN